MCQAWNNGLAPLSAKSGTSGVAASDIRLVNDDATCLDENGPPNNATPRRGRSLTKSSGGTMRKCGGGGGGVSGGGVDKGGEGGVVSGDGSGGRDGGDNVGGDCGGGGHGHSCSRGGNGSGKGGGKGGSEGGGKGGGKSGRSGGRGHGCAKKAAVATSAVAALWCEGDGDGGTVGWLQLRWWQAQWQALCW